MLCGPRSVTTVDTSASQPKWWPLVLMACPLSRLSIRSKDLPRENAVERSTDSIVLDAVTKKRLDALAPLCESRAVERYSVVTVSKVCAMDGKPLAARQSRFCSARCSNRANQIARYGLTPEDFRELTKTGKCVICSRTIRKWHIDHDWSTLETYGPVCSECNTHVLTSIRKSPDGPAIAAIRLAEYFLNPPARMLDGNPRMVTAAFQGIIERRKTQGRRRRYR